MVAALSGHSKAINVARFNPKLFKMSNTEELACYSIVAIASIDSTISVWKP